jgi:hypothetical protein
VRLARFAQRHSYFFDDEAIDGLFAERWQSAARASDMLEMKFHLVADREQQPAPWRV